MKVIIDTKEIETEDKSTVLEVARDNGIFIPSLCDHPNLVPFTGCRLCLIQLKGKKNFVPACSTFVEEGMQVKAQTPALKKLRRRILELILTEHPNACLICQEKQNCDESKSTIRKVGEVTGCVLCPNNGRCQLQDVVEEIGIDKVNFPSVYQEVEIKREDPFFDRNYNLCILCGRCVRICREVRGLSTLTFIQRGPETVVGTALDKSLLKANCQFCGACVDVCPTGALTEKAIKYENLPDETQKTICPLCSVGCTLEVNLHEGRIINTYPAETGEVNQGQACVKGRFLFKDVIYNPLRVSTPQVREGKELEDANWDGAITRVADKLKSYKPEEIAVVGSSQLSCEDFFVLKKFAQNILKTKNFYWGHELNSNAFISGPSYQINEIAQAKTIFLWNANIAVSHPIIWVEVLKAVKSGARLIIASPNEFLFNRYADVWLKIRPGSELALMAALSRLLIEDNEDAAIASIPGFKPFKNSLAALSLEELVAETGLDQNQLLEVVKIFSQDQPSAFVYGFEFMASSEGNRKLTSLRNLAFQTQSILVPLSLENNLRGVFELCSSSSSKSHSLAQIINGIKEKKIKAVYLAGPLNLPKKVKPEFLVIQDSFMNQNVEKAAVVLPAATFTESSGVYVNTEGRLQQSQQIIEPLGESQPDWWILSQIAQKMRRSGLKYSKISEIWNDIRKAYPAFAPLTSAQFKNGNSAFLENGKDLQKKLTPVKLELKKPSSTTKKYPLLLFTEYNLDSYRSLILSEQLRGFRLLRNEQWILLNPQDAEALQLQDGDLVEMQSVFGKTQGIVRKSEQVPVGEARASISPLRFEERPSERIFPVKLKRGT